MTTNTLGTTETEARAEAQRIVAYWHNLGYTQVRASVHPYATHKGKEYICGWTVKSNLNNGKPLGTRAINLKEIKHERR